MPRNITITFDNGQTHTYQNAPDNVTPEQVQQRAESEFGMSVVGIDGGRKTTVAQDVKQGVGNFAAGLLRGAGSIGATLLAPIDVAKDAMSGKGLSLESNRQRRADMDASLSSLGAETDSLAYGAGKLGGEIAGTAGAGGAAANALTKVAPKVAQSAPALIEALRTGGMSAGGQAGIKGAVTRAAGGAMSGGISAGLVNPEDADTGALIGAVAPNVIKVAADAGQTLGKKTAQKYAEELAKFKRSQPLRDTLKESVEAGYVVPPNIANPSRKNAFIEGFTGKDATSQIASVKNQDVTDKLVRQALGIPDDAPITKEVLEGIRKTEGKAYADIANLPVKPATRADSLSNIPATKEFNPAKAVEDLKQARADSQAWYRTYNGPNHDPEALKKAKQFEALANSLEQKIDDYAQELGKPELLSALRDARKQIAKTYTVERALTDGTGTVDARVIGKLFDKGKPLSDGLDKVGKFASSFPSVAKSSQKMGSPAAHKLTSATAMALGGGGAAALGPAGLAGFAIPYGADQLARALMFSKGTQQALANQSAPTLANTQKLAELLANPEVQFMLARSAPVAIASDR